MSIEDIVFVFVFVFEHKRKGRYWSELIEDIVFVFLFGDKRKNGSLPVLSIEDIGAAWDFTPVESECRLLHNFLRRPDHHTVKSRKVKVNL